MDKREIALLAVVLGLTLAIHAPALASSFARDDQLLLYDAVNLPLVEYLLDMHGGHLMPVHKLIIVAMHGLFGYRAWPFFALMLATHLFNVALLYAGLRQIVKAPLAAFGAALWGASIVHHSSLCWFSVYGQVLAVTCFLVVFVEWALSSRKRRGVTRGALLRWNAALITAGASFGVGIALSVAAPLLALGFVARSEWRRTFIGLLPAALTVPVLYALAFASSGGDRGPLGGQFLLPIALRLLIDLPAAGFASLVFGPAATQDNALVLWGPLSSRPLEQVFPFLWGSGLVVMLAVALGYWAAKRPLRRRMNGALGVCVAVYSLIALGRTQIALLMSTTQIATEPRYHYASLLGAVMLVTFALASLATRVGRSRWSHGKPARDLHPIAAKFALLAWLGLLAIPSLQLAGTIQRASITRGTVALRETLAAMNAVIAAAPPGGDVYILNGDYAATRDLFGVRNRPERFPGIAALFAVTHASDTVEGNRIWFVETRADLLDKIRSNPERRIARLIVSSAEANALGAPVYRLPLRTE